MTPIRPDDPPTWPMTRGDTLRQAAAIPGIDPELAAKLLLAAKTSDELDATLLAFLGGHRAR